MKKDEFFQILRKKLAIIEENELNDILSEYEQHIAMKMENGNITEEEAIKDFGNIEELVAEILESYHVKVNYNAKIKEEKQAQLKESAKEIGENTKHFCGKVFQKAKALLKKGWDSTKACFKNVETWISRIAKSEEKEKTFLLGTDKQLPDHIGEKPSRCRKWFSKIAALIQSMFRACFRLCRWAIKMAWNLCVAGIVFFVGIFTCLMLYISGASIVFTVMDYPLLGVFFISFGMVIFSAAVAIAFTFLIKKRKGRKSILSERARAIAKVVILSSAVLGVLLTGIGTGIGVMEFSSFTYGGEKPLFKEKRAVRTVRAEVPLENTAKIELEEVYDGESFIHPEVEFDDSIPMGEICYKVEERHQEIEHTPVVQMIYDSEYDDNVEQNKGEIYSVYLSQNYSESQLKVLMTMKDKVMKDIKNRTVYSYQMSDIVSVKVLVNSKMKPYLGETK